MTITVASSPASFGATRATVGVVPGLLDAERVLDEVRRAGYAGIELGPSGYLGRGRELGERLGTRELGVSSVVLELPFVIPDVVTTARPELDAVLDGLDALRDQVPGPVPRVVLVDAGDDRRRASPGVSHLAPDNWSLDDAGWDRFARGLNAVTLHCRRRGYVAAVRPRAGTFVEAPAEIDAVMRVCDVGLCLDTGQVLIGGGDPVIVLREWSDRVELVYLKDAIRSRMQDVIDEGEPTSAIWSREVFCALGDGDVDCVGVLQQLEVVDFSGWLVVEQDLFASTTDRIARGISDQRRNRQFLKGHGF